MERLDSDIQKNKNNSTARYTKLAIGFIVLFVLAFFALFISIFKPEIKENFKLSLEKIPEDFQNYKYLEDFEDNKYFESVPTNSFFQNNAPYYFLPDSTLILNKRKAKKNFLFKINKEGYITDSCKYEDNLQFYYKTLINFDEELYSKWPLDGKTIEYEIESIDNSPEDYLLDIYKKAEIIVLKERVFLFADGKWYSSDKQFWDGLNEDFLKRDSFNSYRYREINHIPEMKVCYTKRIKYNPSRISGYLQGGSGKPASWDCDLYIDLKLGDTIFPFKHKIYWVKDYKDAAADKSISYIRTSNYCIIENFIIRIK
ncbi:hypothetical protein [Dysgonomonas sp. Marseille-P4361]|uniref:hypothetical protein n=1 Tax=Dysgonomonas sp. Marseille-P4361 TaxID=2161820 RepID=UPI000D55CDC7|nr:hypothetical protein [Dysgonomonas sp. Marseille-P4361]